MNRYEVTISFYRTKPVYIVTESAESREEAEQKARQMAAITAPNSRIKKIIVKKIKKEAIE